MANLERMVETGLTIYLGAIRRMNSFDSGREVTR